ncbi:hypothetical protein [Schlesneria sp.]|uniref:hypothetical protein n=1 Tax=Schlesneria sp. TaxID=2762018 RepID=UPI002EE2B70A
MPKKLNVALIWCLPVIATAFFVVVATAQNKSDEPKKAVPEAKEDLDLSKFMRRKLEASSSILEGLVSEDAESIIRGAKSLVEMSKAEKWQVKNDVMYRQFSTEFQRSATQLLEEAEKRNYDGVALKWMDTTLKCIECHKFVRGLRIAGQ